MFLVAGIVAVFVVAPGTVLAVAAAGSAAVLVTDLARMPKAFEVAPPGEAAAERPAAQRERGGRPVWWPVGRSMLSCSLWLVLGLIWAAAGAWYLAPPMIALFAGFAWNSLRWVWPLPVARRKLLAVMLIPPLAFEMAAQAIRFAHAGWPVRMQVIASAEVLALSLLAVSAGFAMNNWKGLRGGARVLALVYALVFLSGPWGAYVADLYYGRPRGPFGTSFITKVLAVGLARVVPQSTPLVAAGSLILLFALYRMVERQFETSEFLQLQRTQVPDGGAWNPSGLS